jgi:hypothetical protein
VTHLSDVPRRILLGGTIFVSFVGSVGILETKIVKTLIKVGVVVFFAGCFLLPVMQHFFK